MAKQQSKRTRREGARQVQTATVTWYVRVTFGAYMELRDVQEERLRAQRALRQALRRQGEDEGKDEEAALQVEEALDAFQAADIAFERAGYQAARDCVVDWDGPAEQYAPDRIAEQPIEDVVGLVQGLLSPFAVTGQTSRDESSPGEPPSDATPEDNGSPSTDG